MAYSDNFPATRPVFMADFANGGKIDPRATFTRASTANVFDGAKHLSSDNILTYSSTFDNAVWLGGGASRTGGQTDPAGGSNAYTLLEDTTSTYHNAYQSISGNESWALTVYGKQNTGTRYLQLRLYGGSVNNYETAVFDLAGSAPSTASGSSSGFTNVSATQTASGNGFYKCTLKATGSIIFAAIHISQNSTATGLDSYGVAPYTGDNTSSIDIAFSSLSTTGATDYNATTTQIHREHAPSLVSKANNAARFETATDGQSKGILVESQSTNLATYGSDLTNAAWNPLSAFIGGTAVGPDGTLSAVKLVASAGSSLYPRFRRLSFLTDTTQTFSIYVKPLEFQHLIISADGSASCIVQYNLSGSGAITSATGATGAVEQCGNGWFRVSFSYTTVPNAHLAITMQSSTTYQTETGNGYDGMLFALAQLENQSFASSFIGTTSSTATRAADSLSVATADIGYTGGPVSVTAEFNANSVSSGTPRVFALKNGNNIIISYVTSGGSLQTFADVDGTTSVNASVKSGLAANTDYKMAISYGTDDYQGACGGDLGTPDTACALPDLESATLYLGSQDGSYHLNGNLKRLSLFAEALTDTNLQAVTS